MEKILLNNILSECRDEGSLWDFFISVRMLFPERSEQESLLVARDALMWIYQKRYIIFHSSGSKKQVFDEAFISDEQNWALGSEHAHDVFATLTEQGEEFCDNFMQNYVSFLKKEGLIRRGIKYNLASNIFLKYARSGYLFWVSSLVHLLGINPIKLDHYYEKYIKDNRECTVDTRTKTVVKLSIPDDFA